MTTGIMEFEGHGEAQSLEKEGKSTYHLILQPTQPARQVQQHLVSSLIVPAKPCDDIKSSFLAGSCLVG